MVGKRNRHLEANVQLICGASMGDLHRRCHTRQHPNVMAPVEMVSFAGLKTQRHKRSCRAPHFLALPAALVTANRILAAFVSFARSASNKRVSHSRGGLRLFSASNRSSSLK